MVQKKAEYKVPAGGQLAIELPPKAWGVPPIQLDQTALTNATYGIKSTAYVAIWQLNPLLPGKVGSNDGTLLLPDGLLHTEYWVVGRRQTQGDRPSSMAVVATAQGKTSLKIFSKTTTGGSFTLKQGDVLHVIATGYGSDLTGTLIKSSSPVAVFSSSAGARVPDTDICVKTPAMGSCQGVKWSCNGDSNCPTVCCASHIESQLLPVAHWGKKHLAMRSQPRGQSLDSWQITAAQNGTMVQTVPNQFPNQTPTQKLNQGESLAFESGQDFAILSSKPVQVAWTLASSHAPDADNDLCQADSQGTKTCQWQSQQAGKPMTCVAHLDCPNVLVDKDAKLGEAAFTIVPSTSLWRTRHTVVVPAGHGANYINVGIPTGTTVIVDGQTADASQFKSVAGAPLSGTPLSVARLSVQPGLHVIEGAKKITVMLYGWGKGSGYAMAGGMGMEWGP